MKLTDLMQAVYKYFVIVASLLMQGCIAATVVEVVAETVEAGVEITAAVVEGAVDVVTPDKDKDDDTEDSQHDQ